MNTNDTIQELNSQLTRWDNRRRAADMLIWVPRGLLAGLLVAVAIAALARFRPLLTNQELASIAGGLALFSLLISLVALLLQRRSTVEQARFADRRFGLQERTSTAVEIQSGRLETIPALVEQQLNDTKRAVNLVNAKEKLPLVPDWRDLGMVLVAVLLLLAAVILPNPQVEALLQQRAIDKAIADQIEALEAVVTKSRQPDQSVAMTGRPSAMASKGPRPNPSERWRLTSVSTWEIRPLTRWREKVPSISQILGQARIFSRKAL
jgi:hypothetical protein